jgi:hypothetical protein
VSPRYRNSQPDAQAGLQPIRATLTGEDRAEARGLSAASGSPLIALCRKLVEAGHDPATPLEAYRGDVLCLRISSIGEAARLRINAYGTGFRPRPEADTASPMRDGGPPGVRHQGAAQ